jgi:hypothetical protein
MSLFYHVRRAVLCFDVDPKGRGLCGGAGSSIVFFDIDYRKVQPFSFTLPHALCG